MPAVLTGCNSSPTPIIHVSNNPDKAPHALAGLAACLLPSALDSPVSKTEPVLRVQLWIEAGSDRSHARCGGSRLAEGPVCNLDKYFLLIFIFSVCNSYVVWVFKVCIYFLFNCILFNNKGLFGFLPQGERNPF